MKNAYKSRILFFAGCIPARLVLVYIAYLLCNRDKEKSKNYRYPFAFITFLIGISFSLIYLMGWRKTGRETFGQHIWWNDLRPIHSFLYLSFTVALLSDVKWCWMILLVDVLVGIYAELFYKNKKV
jgi:uncharacterized membrane protein